MVKIYRKLYKIVYALNKAIWKTEVLIAVWSHFSFYSLRVFLYSSYTILVHLCEIDGRVPFSNAAAVLTIEVLKVSSQIICTF